MERFGDDHVRPWRLFLPALTTDNYGAHGKDYNRQQR
jgi:hypothetical protein